MKEIEFGSDGWCRDMSQSPKDGTKYLVTDGKAVHGAIQTSNVEICFYEIGDDVSDFDTYEPIAWRYLPNLSFKPSRKKSKRYVIKYEDKYLENNTKAVQHRFVEDIMDARIFTQSGAKNASLRGGLLKTQLKIVEIDIIEVDDEHF